MRISDWSSDVCSSDLMQKTAGAVDLYDVAEFEPEMRDIAGLIVDAARLTVEALPLLRNISANGPRLHELTERLVRSEEHTSELQSLMRISYAVFCVKNKKETQEMKNNTPTSYRTL